MGQLWVTLTERAENGTEWAKTRFTIARGILDAIDQQLANLAAVDETDFQDEQEFALLSPAGELLQVKVEWYNTPLSTERHMNIHITY